MTICEDPFAVLGVSSEASPADVKRAYRRLAMHWHQDQSRHGRHRASAVSTS
ncbi:MAG TPA: J domain-containing protein, partial [Accumulibacter sp.]|nr:J domain-containing protein [Accumulibacter sp.]